MKDLRLKLALLPAAVALVGAQSASGAVIAAYNLGEDDAGSAAGLVGNDPTTAVVGMDLTRVDGPMYSSDVPAGGSTLSMAFDGDGDYYFSDAPTTDLSSDITIAFDAKGEGHSRGFSFLASLGSNYGGISVIEIGGSVKAFMPGAGAGDGGFDLAGNTGWHRYELNWDADATTLTLSVDGSVVSTRVGNPANNQIVDIFTLGGNSRSADPAAPADPPFEGSFLGNIDNVEISEVPIPEPSSLVLCGLGMGLLIKRKR